MAEIKIDHTKDDLSSIGWTLDDIHEISSKCAPISKGILLHGKKFSHIVEEVMQKLTFNELVFLASQEIMKTSMKAADEPIVKLIMDLQKAMKKDEE